MPRKFKPGKKQYRIEEWDFDRWRQIGPIRLSIDEIAVDAYRRQQRGAVLYVGDGPPQNGQIRVLERDL